MTRTRCARSREGLPALVRIAGLLVLSVLLATPAGAVNTVAGNIAVNTTWTASPDPIWFVDSSVTVLAGVTLTIEPGVTVKFDLYTDLNVDGVLSAIGGATVDSTIWFTSIRDDNLPPGGDDTNGDGNATIPATSNWGNIRFRTPASGASVLENCEMWFGGYYNEGMVVCDGASPTLQACALNAGYYGVQCIDGASPTLDDTDVSACASVPVAISIDSNPVFSSVTFSSTSDNAYDAIGILSTTLASGSNVIPVRGTTIGGSPIPNVTYMLLGDVTIAAGATLTIDPGVVIKPLNTGVDVLVDGTLSAVGTAGSPIVFTSFKDDGYGAPNDTNNDGSSTAPASGDWGGLAYRDGSAGALAHCVVRYGGYGSWNSDVAMKNVGTAVSVTDCTISDAVHGLEIAGVSDPAVTGTAISNCGETPIFMSVSADPTFSGNTFSGNGITALGIIPETVAVDSRLRVRDVAGYANITYVLDGDLHMDVGAQLVVDPAVVLKFRDTYSALDISGSLWAVGTADPDSQVVFTSWKDDNFGNPSDTNGDGSASTPAHSDWSWIVFRATSIDVDCRLEHCFLGYGGVRSSQAWNGVVWCENASPTITNNQFWVDRIGATCYGNSQPTITYNDFFGSYSVPILVSALASPDIHDNTYDQNGYHAIGLVSETLSANATISPGLAGVNHPGQGGRPFPYYLVNGPLTVGSSAVLTIDPGVVIKASSYGMIVNGGLLAQDPSGTNPIVFTGIRDDGHGGDSNVDGNATSPSNGDWPAIEFSDTSVDGSCILEGVQFWYGGSSGAVVRMTNASPTIADCSFEFNNKGIWVQGLSDPTITGNLIRQCTWTPIVLDLLADPTFGGNTFDANGLTSLGIIGGSLAQDATLPVRDVAGFTNITYTLDSQLTIQFGATLTVVPGVVIKFWSGSYPYYPGGYRITVQGGLVMDATPAEPIVLTSVEDDTVGNPLDTNTDGSLTAPAPGEWYGLVFGDVSDDPNCVLDEVEMRYGGAADALVKTSSAAPTLTNCTIERSYWDGVRCDGVSEPTISGCSFVDNNRCPVTVSLLSNPVFSGNTISGNGYSGIGVIGETLAQDVTWTRRAFAGDDNREYVLLNTMTVGTGANLTIQPGVVVKPLAGVSLVVRRGLFARGGAEPESLIAFTSVADDFYGGDTNGDGAATSGANSRWGTIRIEPTALNANVVFENCALSWATTSTAEGAVTLQGTLSPDFTNCIFAHNTNGLNYTQASGDSTAGKVLDCDFFDHSAYAIKNTGLAHVVSARNCWWGDDTGPTHASNPGGLGDSITDMVAFAPWKGMGLGNYHVGDVSLNGEIHAYDASLVLQHTVGAITLTPQQQVIGNVDCDASLLAFDAAQILMYVTDLIVTFPCLEVAQPVDVAILDGERPGGRGDGIAPAPAVAVESVGDGAAPRDTATMWQAALVDVDLREGGIVRVPLVVRGGESFHAAQFTLRPDGGAVRIREVLAGPAAEGALFAARVDDAGVARIALASAQPIVPGTLALLVVEVLPEPVPTRDLAIEFLEAIVDADDVLVVALGSRGLVATGPALPDRFELAQNRPNPFRAGEATIVRFLVPAVETGSVPVDLAVFGVDGRRVRTIASGPYVPGEYEERWDGRDDGGQRVASGVYFYRLRAGSFVDQKKMVLLK